MRKSVIFALAGYATTALLAFNAVMAFSTSFGNYDKHKDMNNTNEDYGISETYSKYSTYLAEHPGVNQEDYVPQAERQEYLRLEHEYELAQAKSEYYLSTGRILFWSWAIPSTIVTLLGFAFTTAIWTELQKKDI